MNPGWSQPVLPNHRIKELLSHEEDPQGCVVPPLPVLGTLGAGLWDSPFPLWANLIQKQLATASALSLSSRSPGVALIIPTTPYPNLLLLRYGSSLESQSQQPCGGKGTRTLSLPVFTQTLSHLDKNAAWDASGHLAAIAWCLQSPSLSPLFFYCLVVKTFSSFFLNSCCLVLGSEWLAPPHI